MELRGKEISTVVRGFRICVRIFFYLIEGHAPVPRDRPRGPRAVPFRGVRGGGFEPRMPDVSNSGLVCRYVAFPHMHTVAHI